jgi:hypothetical protein
MKRDREATGVKRRVAGQPVALCSPVGDKRKGWCHDMEAES